jgi:type I site-specific restriction-modification system R (restriction) subunit
VFEVDLLKSQEINLDYILELIFEHNKKTKDKANLVEEVRRLIRASVGNRAKESLVVDFINQADLDALPDKAGVIEAFFSYARSEQQREAGELIAEENLNSDAAKRYISTSLKREYAKRVSEDRGIRGEVQRCGRRGLIEKISKDDKCLFLPHGMPSQAGIRRKSLSSSTM